MKKNYYYRILLAGLILAVTGCGEQKQPIPQKKTHTKPQLKPKRLTLEDALKKKFNVDTGWDASNKRFITVAELRGVQKDKKRYSITLLHNGQIPQPDFHWEFPGALIALGKLSNFIQNTVTTENTILICRSSALFGQLKVKTEERSNGQTGKITTNIKVLRGKDSLFILDEGEEKISYQYRLAAPDINLFKSLMAANGLKFTLIGWSEENGAARLAFSIRELSNWKEMVKTVSQAQLEYTKKEVRKNVKIGMKKLSRKLDEWSEEDAE